MELYDVLFFFHITFVALWLGGGFLLHLLGWRADRSGDEGAMRNIVDQLVATANIFFIPSSLGALLFGILLTIEGPWSFGDLWIVLGLAGFAITFLTGLLWIKPQSERLQKVMERDGGLSAEADWLTRRLMTFARLDYVVLLLVVLDMTVKPETEHVGTLVFMALVLVAGAAYFGWRARSLERPAAVAA